MMVAFADLTSEVGVYLDGSHAPSSVVRSHHLEQ
jgi:hypothetical protein